MNSYLIIFVIFFNVCIYESVYIDEWRPQNGNSVFPCYYRVIFYLCTDGGKKSLNLNLNLSIELTKQTWTVNFVNVSLRIGMILCKWPLAGVSSPFQKLIFLTLYCRRCFHSARSVRDSFLWSHRACKPSWSLRSTYSESRSVYWYYYSGSK